MSDFTLELDSWLDESMEVADKQVRAIGLEAVKGLVLMTPVSTGRARGNWQVNQSGDAPETGREDKAGSITLLDESKNIAKQDRRNMFWICNGVPYIEELENGHSRKQAPRGMLAVTFNRLRAFIRG